MQQSLAQCRPSRRWSRRAEGAPTCRATVVLEQRDELLHSIPLHVAAERGHLEAVQV